MIDDTLRSVSQDHALSLARHVAGKGKTALDVCSPAPG